MPTSRPRYTFTDTGHLTELLDVASRRWPEVPSRKQLLLRLAEEGYRSLAEADLRLQEGERRERIRKAMRRIPSLVDEAILLADQAWN